MRRRSLLGALTLFTFAWSLFAQPVPSGGLAVKLGLERLQTLGSVLMIAAHPDDENTALLAYFALGKHYRTGYLSLTRGEGGQNLIGSEQGPLLGLIRTQELLAARRLDGAEQYFTRAIDFGFSKTADETLRKWGREKVLGDVVWAIRRFQPDIIVLRFSGTPRDGHGHHQSSAILGLEAFSVAADPNRFPEQLKYVKPWKARSIYWNVFSFNRQMERQAAALPNRLTVDTGLYNPELGFSYGEIAGLSRSMHRSQAMGAAQRKGTQPESLVLRAGESAKADPFEIVDLTWNRVPGGKAVGDLISEAAKSLDLRAPEKVIPTLLKARLALAAIDHPWAAYKLQQLNEVIAQAAGLSLEVSASTFAAAPSTEVSLNLTAINRSAASVQLTGVQFTGMEGAEALSGDPVPLADNRPYTRTFKLPVPANQPYSQVYWLRQTPSETLYNIADPQMIGLPEGPPVLTARFQVRIDNQGFDFSRPVIHRYVDPARGELRRAFTVVPQVAVEFSESGLIFPTAAAKKVEVQLRANIAKAAIELTPRAPQGWRIEPAAARVELGAAGEAKTASFLVTPPATDSVGVLEFPDQTGVRVIDHEHIPPQTVYPRASLKLVRTDAKLLSKKVGYIMGAGDDVPQALRQLGAAVSMLSTDDLTFGDLSDYDAIVVGVRAYNTRRDIRANQKRLMDYVSKGGTYIVQYNVAPGGFTQSTTNPLENIGPYPLTVSRDRITVEDAPMRNVDPDSPLLTAPNRITERDYEGWVQERGLYFADKWDPQYKPLWEMADPNEKPMQGGTLYARYGKGVYIFTPMSWFRQLPAGVPGAYRIFANFLSAGKVIQ